VSVRAGGGVVWRPSGEGAEVVLVHRPKYGDWSLPKGKAEGSETVQAAALREVGEETGLPCRLGPYLTSTSYVDGQSRPKTVCYWAMTPEPGSSGSSPAPAPEAAEEVDLAEWVPLSEARQRLSYECDRAVLDSFKTLVAWDETGPSRS
jgi:8-oxo-dGTP pyrophosphatase MutT (NUDIX family)